MLPLLTAEAMRAADRETIESFGISGFTLMESAARGTLRALAEHFGPPPSLRVTIICGKGNNGGDGLALARMLHEEGAWVRAVVLDEKTNLSSDAAYNYALLEKIAAEADDGLSITRYGSVSQLQEESPPPDLYVDALLGTGLTSELREPIQSIVEWLNRQLQPVAAIDIPTGLHTDTGEALGAAVRSDVTATMGARKTGLVLGEGPAHAGAVEVIPIGIPHYIFRRVLDPSSNSAATGSASDELHTGCAWWTTRNTIQSWMPRRSHDAHKYSAGLALVVGGAPGMTGAPAMASQAAARVGAGAVVCACSEEIQPVLAEKLTEVMTLGLPHTNDGIDGDEALQVLSDRMEQAEALLIGPGLGKKPETQAFVTSILAATELPVVIDADGLNALAGQMDWVADNAQGKWILTPHAGEFKRLAGPEADLKDRIRTAQKYAARWNCVLLLKGLPSIAAGPGGSAFVNSTGGPALATAGTGDVLAGLCAGLLAQGQSPVRAAVSALYLGGAAADRYGKTRHPHAMQATDMLDELPYTMKSLED